ncbi:MAG: M56 family metallopeptidase [Candidatus Sericytochromatia bacterium]
MGFRAVVALALTATLMVAWHQLRTRTDRASVQTTLGLLLLPALLLLVADGYALYLFAHGCAAPGGGFWQATGLGALLLANAALAASSWRAWRQARHIRRVVNALPRLDEALTQRLAIALPALSGVSVRVCPGDQPVLFTTGKRRPAIVVSDWVLANLDEQELIAALAHELGHIAHGDGRLLLLVHALCPGGLGLFREPLRQLSLGLEQRADAWATATLADRLALASALVKVSRSSLPRHAPAPAFAGQAGTVHTRVKAMLDGDIMPPAPHWSDWWPVVALGLGASFLALQAVSRLCGLHAG